MGKEGRELDWSSPGGDYCSDEELHRKIRLAGFAPISRMKIRQLAMRYPPGKNILYVLKERCSSCKYDLGSVCVLSSICHGQLPWLVVLEGKVLILELFACMSTFSLKP